jgi:hypothetical protein
MLEGKKKKGGRAKKEKAPKEKKPRTPRKQKEPKEPKAAKIPKVKTPKKPRYVISIISFSNESCTSFMFLFFKCNRASRKKKSLDESGIDPDSPSLGDFVIESPAEEMMLDRSDINDSESGSNFPLTGEGIPSVQVETGDDNSAAASGAESATDVSTAVATPQEAKPKKPKKPRVKEVSSKKKKPTK